MFSCDGGENDQHQHQFIEGKCECGEVDSNYQEHVHEFVDGECSCGEVDPDYEEHEHIFFNGECECGEKDPNYKTPTQSSGCSMGTYVSVMLTSMIGLVYLVIKRK